MYVKIDGLEIQTFPTLIYAEIVKVFNLNDDSETIFYSNEFHQNIYFLSYDIMV